MPVDVEGNKTGKGTARGKSAVLQIVVAIFNELHLDSCNYSL